MLSLAGWKWAGMGWKRETRWDTNYATRVALAAQSLSRLYYRLRDQHTLVDIPLVNSDRRNCQVHFFQAWSLKHGSTTPNAGFINERYWVINACILLEILCWFQNACFRDTKWVLSRNVYLCPGHNYTIVHWPFVKHNVHCTQCDRITFFTNAIFIKSPKVSTYFITRLSKLPTEFWPNVNIVTWVRCRCVP